MNPLDWTSPTFLIAYPVLMAILSMVALLSRNLLRLPARQPKPHELDLDVYEVAALAGSETAVKAAVVALVQGKVLAPRDDSLTVLTALPASASRLESSVYNTVKESRGSLSSLQEGARVELEQLEQSLRQRGFVLTPQQSIHMHLWPWLLVGLGLLLGIVKMWEGLSQGRPGLVGLLLLEGLIAVALTASLLKSSHKRTRRGCQALDLLRKKPTPGNLVLATALFGPSALMLLKDDPLHTYLEPPAPVIIRTSKLHILLQLVILLVLGVLLLVFSLSTLLNPTFSTLVVTLVLNGLWWRRFVTRLKIDRQPQLILSTTGVQFRDQPFRRWEEIAECSIARFTDTQPLEDGHREVERKYLAFNFTTGGGIAIPITDCPLDMYEEEIIRRCQAYRKERGLDSAADTRSSVTVSKDSNGFRGG